MQVCIYFLQPSSKTKPRIVTEMNLWFALVLAEYGWIWAWLYTGPDTRPNLNRNCRHPRYKRYLGLWSSWPCGLYFDNVLFVVVLRWMIGNTIIIEGSYLLVHSDSQTELVQQTCRETSRKFDKYFGLYTPNSFCHSPSSCLESYSLKQIKWAKGASGLQADKQKVWHGLRIFWTVHTH